MAATTFPARLVRTARFTRGEPSRFVITRDGATVLFVRGRTGDDPAACLWALDVESGAERLLADPAALAASAGPAAPSDPSAAGAGITGYATDGAGRLAVFALCDELWLARVDPDGCRVRRLPVEGPVSDPCPDPAGRRIGYLSGGALRVVEADGTGDRAVAVPPETGVCFGAVEHADLTAPSSGAGGARGFWWEPDGSRLLATRVDSSAVPLWHLADLSDPGAAPRALRYPAAGGPNAEVTLWIIGLDGRRVQAHWDSASFEYVVGGGWDAHGPHAVVQSRDQCTVRFLAIDPDGGGTSVIAEQRDERWVHLAPGLPARTASGAVVWFAEHEDTRRLTISGVPVTRPGLQVREVLGVDGEELLFTASEEPTEIQLWNYWPAAGAHRVSTTSGVHSGVARAGTLVHAARSDDRIDARIKVSRHGLTQALVTSEIEQPELVVRRETLSLGARELRGALYVPNWYDGSIGALPVLLDPYGGAGRQRVTAELDWRMLTSQWLAEHGFAVLVVDGRGTPGRGPAWERAVHGDLFGAALDDQIDALHDAARRRPELDLERVGIRGWSFGGSLALYAVLRRPDVFHAAVAGGAVTDQRLYFAHWRERALGHPDRHPERYAANSLLELAPLLERPLLLMHGLADTNVHPAHALRLSEALLAADRAHELLLLPRVGHQAIGSAATENMLRRQVDFLRRHLRAEIGPGAEPEPEPGCPAEVCGTGAQGRAGGCG